MESDTLKTLALAPTTMNSILSMYPIRVHLLCQLEEQTALVKFEVSSDPIDVVLDTTTNLGFVGNRTSHDVSIINIARDPMQIIPPLPLEVLGEATFTDVMILVP